MFENTVEGICWTSPSGRILRANNAFAQMFGYDSPEDVLSHVHNVGVQIYVDRNRREEFVRLLEQNETVSGFESFVRRKDDSTFWVLEIARAVRDEDNRLLYYEVSLIDVTRRKESEERLRESQERYMLAAQGANDGLWDWDIRKNSLYLSPRWHEMLGFEKPLPPTLDTWMDRVHSDDRYRLNSRLHAHLDALDQHFQDEHRLLHADGDYRWVLCRGLAVRDSEGQAYRVAGSFTDISDRKAAESRLVHEIMHDKLTGLPNRQLLLDRLRRAMARVRRKSDYQFAVLFLDLDRFKVINDSMGHQYGDELLIKVSQRLESSLRSLDTVSRSLVEEAPRGNSETVARLGGDEFIILLEEISGPDHVRRVADRILREVSAPIDLGGSSVVVSVSIGIAMGSPEYQGPEDILRDADTAMYSAKSRGKSRHEVFQSDMHLRAMNRLRLENELRNAMEHGQLEVYYQPIVSLANDRISGFECLTRWNHPKRGLLEPNDFLALAEETGLIQGIDRWVLRQACQKIAAWNNQYPADPPLFVTVNVSGRLLLNQDFPRVIENLLKEMKLAASCLRIDIPESAVLYDTNQASNVVCQLRSQGIEVSIDDFGVGYSNLKYLRTMPLSSLKIDRTLVNGITHDSIDAEIVKMVVLLARKLGLRVTAEGVENLEQKEALQLLQCGDGQGHHFSKAICAASAEAMLASQRKY